jgi:hypothetical protein
VPVEDCRPPTTLVGLSVNEETVGSGGGVTVRVIAVVCVKAPDVPVMVAVTVPAVAALLTASVNVLVVVVELGLNDALTPLGSPDAEKLTPPVKPFWGETVIVLVPLPPWVMLTLLGDAESVKFGCVVTVSVAVWVTPPKDAETVTVVDADATLVVTVKLALVAPAATVTLESTLAAVVLLLESATCAPPERAGPLNVTVPVEEFPPVTLVGFNESEEREMAAGTEDSSKSITAGLGSFSETATNFEGEII